MSDNANNRCPRCQNVFLCRADDIASCQCNAVKLSDAERQYINEHFDDCLCANCMTEMKGEYFNKQIKNMLKPDR